MIPATSLGNVVQNFLDHGQTFIGELLIFGFGSGIIDEREGDLEVAGDEAVKIAGDDRVVVSCVMLSAKIVRPWNA